MRVFLVTAVLLGLSGGAAEACGIIADCNPREKPNGTTRYFINNAEVPPPSQSPLPTGAMRGETSLCVMDSVWHCSVREPVSSTGPVPPKDFFALLANKETIPSANCFGVLDSSGSTCVVDGTKAPWPMTIKPVTATCPTMGCNPTTWPISKPDVYVPSGTKVFVDGTQVYPNPTVTYGQTWIMQLVCTAVAGATSTCDQYPGKTTTFTGDADARSEADCRYIGMAMARSAHYRSGNDYGFRCIPSVYQPVDLTGSK